VTTARETLLGAVGVSIAVAAGIAVGLAPAAVTGPVSGIDATLATGFWVRYWSATRSSSAAATTPATARFRAASERTVTEPDDPGESVDDALRIATEDADSPLTQEARASVRERVRVTAVRVRSPPRRRRGPGGRRRRRGEWTSDVVAAAFVGDERAPPFPLRERLRGGSTPSGFTGAAPSARRTRSTASPRRWPSDHRVAVLGRAAGHADAGRRGRAQRPAHAVRRRRHPLVFVVYGALSTPASPERLRLTRSLSKESPLPGDRVRVTLTVENAGDSALPDVRVADGVPDGLRVVDGQTEGAFAVPSGESTTLEYTVVADRGSSRSTRRRSDSAVWVLRPPGPQQSTPTGPTASTAA